MFQLEVQLTKDVYGKVMAAILIRKYRWIYVLIGFLAIAFVFNAFYGPGPRGRWDDYLFPAGFAILIIALPVAQSVFGMGWKNHPIASQRAEFVFTVDGLKISGITYQSYNEWSNFLSIRQLKSAVILFFTRNQVIIIPSSSFSSTGERERVVAFLREHIPLGNQQRLKSGTLKRVGITVAIWVAIVIGVYLYMTLTRH